MTISIDLDKTWTADPELWCLFAEHARLRGHKVILATRRETVTASERNGYKFPAWMPVWECGLAKFKRDAVPFPVDIWIDDEPGTVEPQRLLEEPSDSSL